MKSRSQKRTLHEKASGSSARCQQKRGHLLPALLAGSACGLAVPTANAVQLADIEVQSALGQPLRASIAYALSPNEQIYSYCIYLRPGMTADGLPALNRARLTIADGRINILGSVPIREPILALGLTINCPYTANLTRSYTLMLDPFQPVPVARPAPVQGPDRAVAPRIDRPTATAARPDSITRRDENRIALTTTYRVTVGDTLSGIASRIENRPVGLWQAVDALFAANPDAFIGDDPNMLKAGALLTIPSFDGVTAPTVNVTQTNAAPESVAEASPVVEAGIAASGEAYSGIESADPDEGAAGGAGTSASEAAATGVENRPSDLGSPPLPEFDQSADLRPGDVQISGDRAFVSPIEATPEVDTAVETTALSGIDLPAEAAGTDDAGGGIYRWLYWLAGTGVALFLGLVLFGRRLRERGGAPAAPGAESPGIADDEPTDRNQTISGVDYDIGVEPVTDRRVVLDADLSAGTGLGDGTEIEVAEDFGFSTTHDLGSEVDMLIPEEPAENSETTSTDIIPPRLAEKQSILEREILPSDDDEYDLSMIVDATKQKFADGDVTAKDLMAIPVADEAGGDYTLSKEIDYKILEQDYEDELTATQALNAEIAKAALELAHSLENSSGDTANLEAPDDVTVEDTAEVIAGDDDETEILSDLDDTGVNDEVTAEIPPADSAEEEPHPDSDVTVEMPARESAERKQRRDLSSETMANTELTEELPVAKNDSTVEMDVESGRFSTKKSVG